MPAMAANSAVTVAIVKDGELEQHKDTIEDVFLDELRALLEGEFELTLKTYSGQWSAAGIQSAFAQAHADSSVDMVLALGPVSNQVGAKLRDFSKPTFLPLVFDAQLLGVPADGDSSGFKNLNYLTDRVNFRQELASFGRLVELKSIALVVDEIILDAIPEIAADVERLVADLGIGFEVISYGPGDRNVVSRIGPSIDGVMVAGLPRMPDAELAAMVQQLIDRKLPSFSLVGTDLVHGGLLASDATNASYRRLSRLNALNMQAVLLGERTQDQRINFQAKRELTINMDTARKLDLWPRFDVLSEATLINQEEVEIERIYTFESIARQALVQNLDLMAERIAVAAGEQTVRQARSTLLPQLSLSASTTARRITPIVSAGQLPQRSTDGALGVSQLLYSDDVWANLSIQKYLQFGREEAQRLVELDVVRDTTIAYLNVLRARTQLRVQQDNLNLTKANLELARNRVEIGSSSAADLYRWQAQMASTRRAVLDARAAYDQSRELLNLLLNRPLTESFDVESVDPGAPFVLTQAEFDGLVFNQKRYNRMAQFQIEQGLRLAPELAQIDASIQAKEREVANLRRDFWLPDVSVSGQYSDNIANSGAGSDLFVGRSDWNIGVNASIPLFAGGGRRADLARARLELEQLQIQRDSAALQISQSIRASLHLVSASYANIELSREAAVASKKNLDLVTDSYAKGVVSIIDLLDAQNSSVVADEAAANAEHDFLVEVMNWQRRVGQFDVLLSPAEKAALAVEIKQYVQQD